MCKRSRKKQVNEINSRKSPCFVRNLGEVPLRILSHLTIFLPFQTKIGNRTWFFFSLSTLCTASIFCITIFILRVILCITYVSNLCYKSTLFPLQKVWEPRETSPWKLGMSATGWQKISHGRLWRFKTWGALGTVKWDGLSGDDVVLINYSLSNSHKY